MRFMSIVDAILVFMMMALIAIVWASFAGAADLLEMRRCAPAVGGRPPLCVDRPSGAAASGTYINARPTVTGTAILAPAAPEVGMAGVHIGPAGSYPAVLTILPTTHVLACNRRADAVGMQPSKTAKDREAVLNSCLQQVRIWWEAKQRR
jgi:hypothetical protein